VLRFQFLLLYIKLSLLLYLYGCALAAKAMENTWTILLSTITRTVRNLLPFLIAEGITESFFSTVRVGSDEKRFGKNYLEFAEQTGVDYKVLYF
jgi:hypothetical protein